MVGKWLESLDYDFQISNDCVRYKSPKATCSSCSDHCNESAIVFRKGKPFIDDEKCTECGVCLLACPVQKIEGIYPKRNVIGNQLDVREEKEPIAVKELLILHACGLKSILATEERLTDIWMNNIKEANEILEQVNRTPFTIEFSTAKKEDLAYSRRQFFALWKKEGESILKEVAPASWRFNHDSLCLNKYYPDHQFATISLDINKCSLCKACEFLCPKNCFQVTEDQFIISAQGCSNCKLCENTCLEEAIQIFPQIKEKEVVAFQVYKHECEDCRRGFQTLRAEDQKCHVCAKRKNNYLSSGVC